MKISNKFGFTLVEILVGILIFTLVILCGFYALNVINVGKIKLMQDVNITKDSYYFTEKLFDEIKKGGSIDFEEYFNRIVVGNDTQSGFYVNNTGFGNFGDNGTLGTTTYGNGFYYCRSTTTFMGTGGCYSNSYNTLGASVLGKPQRYGEYYFQFIDYNSNKNDDSSSCGVGYNYGDENCDGNIRSDDDDENLGLGPIVFTGGTNAQELYLISADGKKRTLLRWHVYYDKNHPTYSQATQTNTACNFSTLSGSGCYGTIEILKLDGKDYGFNHNATVASTGSFDGVIDTWFINKDFAGGNNVIAGSDSINYRQPIFPDTINVKSFKVFLYPNIDISNNWKDVNPENNINPYVRLNITLTPSRKKIPAMKGNVPEINISTTINLADYFY